METRDQQDTERQVHDLTVIVDDLTSMPVAKLTPHKWDLMAAMTKLQFICSAVSSRRLEAAE